MRKHLKTTLISGLGLATLLSLSSCASSNAGDPTTKTDAQQAQAQSAGQENTYNETDLVGALSTQLGVNSESAASMIERIFSKQGRPVGYITGEEGGIAVVGGLRYGSGTLWMKDGRTAKVYWQGPSVGWDFGANGSKVFTLVYGLTDPNLIYRRFPGVEGSAYVIGGMGVNYQRAEGITLAPVRTGVGARLGANVGYLSYSKKRRYIPL